jgi:hypothetical protein
MDTHADENSDGVIVPEKRSNKGGLPSAETVECAFQAIVITNSRLS